PRSCRKIRNAKETAVELTTVAIDKPADVNFILGQSHFIKTIEDLHEAIMQTVPQMKFGIAFCESSGPALVRRTGNDAELVELAQRNALALSCGHCFIVFRTGGFPINILNTIKAGVNTSPCSRNSRSVSSARSDSSSEPGTLAILAASSGGRS